jgi:sugar lactone lactonase YvrE
VTIGNTVTNIGASAFAGCTSLTNLAIGTGVTSIGNSAFSGCASLSSVVIPDSVTSLGASAFYNCPSLTSVILGNGVSSVGNSTFEYCSSLTNVVIPNSVATIGPSGFYGCTSLANLTIGTGVTSIASGAFGNCPHLTSLTVVAINIPSQAFQNLTSLTNVIIANGVTSIQGSAFQGCSGLTSVTIPPSVTSIGTSAFASCTRLTNLTIGSGVTSIGNSAFSGSGFASVTIPASVTSIGSYAFGNCYSLTRAYFLGNMPSGDSTIFSGESGAAWYLPGATGWGSTFGGWPAILWGTAPSIIAVQPQDQAVAVGYSMSLSVGKSNNVMVNGVQWLKGSQPIPMTTKPTFTLSGSVNYAYYNITNVQPTNAGTYSVVFSNALGVETSRVATVVVFPAATFITMAGGMNGTNDGLGTAAAFNSPRHIVVDTAGNLFVTDFYNSTIRKITPAGLVSTVAGLPGVAGTNDGYGSNARFVLPHGIAVDKSGNLFVTDFGYGWTNGAIRKISPDGMVTTIAGSLTGSGTNDGPGGAALFDGPMGIVVDDDENLFVSDGFNGTIRKLTPDGTNWDVSTIAGLAGSSAFANSFTDGTNSDARFGLPDGLAMDQAHNIFVADEGWSGPGTIRKITSVGTNWVVSTIITLPITVPLSNPLPSAVAVDTNRNLYVTAQAYGLIEKIIPDGTNWLAATIAGSSQSATIVNGTGISNSFYYPHGIALDKLGNMYLVDYAANVVRKGWSSDSPAACVLNPPQITAGQVQLGVLVQTGTPTNFTLFQADQINGPWTTNSSWLLTTNIPGLNYGMAAPVDGSPFRFYRLQCQ